MRLIDSHCHLDAGEFDADRDAVIERAARAGVVVQVIPAVTASTFNALAELCRGRHDLFAAYGLSVARQICPNNTSTTRAASIR